eukprot:gene28376-22426_t
MGAGRVAAPGVDPQPPAPPWAHIIRRRRRLSTLAPAGSLAYRPASTLPGGPVRRTLPPPADDGVGTAEHEGGRLAGYRDRAGR